VDTSINPGVDGEIFAFAIQTDGKIVVGGQFSTLGGLPRDNLGRLNANGTLDSDFGAGANGQVYALTIQSDGKILVGGRFLFLNGESRGHVGRLHPDGSLDMSFDPSVNPDTMAGKIRAFLVQPDGKILLGGSFSQIAGATRLCLARIESDGSLDTSFDAELTTCQSDGVLSLALQADGKIVAAGAINVTIGLQYFDGILRFGTDGSMDTTFDPGLGYATAMSIQADGKMVMAGEDSHLHRVTNDIASTQELSLNGSGTAVTWMRGGSSPEVSRVLFEQSTNGVTFSPLGEGVRISGGWELTGLAIPLGENRWIRARGFFLCGQDTGWDAPLAWNQNVYLPQYWSYLPMTVRQ